MATDYVDIPFDNVIKETKAAILFDVGEDEGVWIPKRTIDMDNYCMEDHEVPVAEKWAINAGLV